VNNTYVKQSYDITMFKKKYVVLKNVVRYHYV